MMITIKTATNQNREYLSPNLELIQAGPRALLYDRLQGGGIILEGSHIVLAEHLLAQSFSRIEDVVVTPSRLEWESFLALLRHRGFLRSSSKMEPDPRLDPQLIARGRFVNQLSLMVTLKCNYACIDCFVYNEPSNIVSGPSSFMSKEIAEQALIAFFNLPLKCSQSDIVVRLFGGEPLLNWSLVKFVVNWVRSKGFKCQIYLTTNAALLDDRRLRFLMENKVRIFVSINGVKQVNDKTRINHSGMGTFDSTIKPLSNYVRWAEESHISVTLHDSEAIERLPELLNLLDDFLEDPESPIVIYLSLLKGLVNESNFALSDEDIADLLAQMWIEWLPNNIFLGGRIFHCLYNVFRKPLEFDRWCQRGASYVVYPDGGIRPCSGTKYVIGQVSDPASVILSSSEFQSVSCRVGGQIKGCKGCMIEGLCGGSCACSSKAPLNEYQPGINCNLERVLFKTLVKAMLTVDDIWQDNDIVRQ